MKPGEGTVIVDNGAIDINQSYTALPAKLNPAEDLSRMRLETHNNARLGLTVATTVETTTLQPNGLLELGGLTLTTGRLCVSGNSFPVGIYTVADSTQFQDSVGGGQVKVVGLKETTIIILK